MLLDRLHRSGVQTRLHALRHSPAMIEDVRKMIDLMCLELLGETQQEIVVVRSAKAGTKSKRLGQVSRKDCQLRDKVSPKQERPVPVRFEMGFGPVSGGIQLIFVTVNQAGFALVVDRAGHQVKRSWRPLVLTSKGKNEFAFGERQNFIQRVSDFSLLPPTNLDPAIALRSLDDLPRLLRH